VDVEPTADPAGAFVPDEKIRATAASVLDAAAEVLDVKPAAFTYAGSTGSTATAPSTCSSLNWSSRT
jgi:hypothetical protein